MKHSTYPSQALVADMRDHAQQPIGENLRDIQLSWDQDNEHSDITNTLLTIAVASIIVAGIAIIIAG
jgi:hypothetical protein